ncbi:tudor domain-containing protein 15 [Labrus mixtus]|uniref:tudor domain-containing protein 15 n=1 Tax=Labrus mixtus TaxID=508554 RepID=UPI0029BFF751|nr:tudor domain-containing protein 15 [Labrus mixtus]
MQSLGSEHQKSLNSGQSAPCALWPVDLKLTHLDWNPEATLIHFQGQYLTICELDYTILQGEIQNTPKNKAAVDIGEFCLIEDLTSARWYRGRVQNRKEDLFDVFLIDHDKMYPGFAAAVTTPFEFCLVLEDLLLIMNKLSLMLDDLPEQMPPLPEAHLVPGTCCLIKSESKNKWCRAEIVNADTTAVLNLVDYGHCECMQCEDFSELKVLPAEMTNVPKVTFPCILRGVKPVDEDGQWTDDAAVFFQQCLYQKNLQIFFREFESNTHWKVDILADGVHVAKELVDAGHANYIDVMLGLRFQEQSLCKASDGTSHLSVDFQDEAGTMPLSAVSGSRHCFLM